MFEIATRKKFRFPFRGVISVEDLWVLPVEDLDSIFKVLNSQLKEVKEESLLKAKTKANKELETKIEIIKHIVATKLEEENKRLKTKEQKEKKQKILDIIETKQDESLQTKSIDELKRMLDELN